MKNFLIGIMVTVIVLAIAAVVFFSATPLGKKIWNDYAFKLEKVDETSYENQKKVEDTCRSMISSYNADKLIYEQYKESSVEEQISWANNAKIRANQTASTYNNFILKNSFVWEGNVPADIFMALALI